MASEKELHAVAQLVDRLRKKFPQLPVSRVLEVVDTSYHELDGAPIRSFVPILVEKQARDRIAQLVA